MADHRICIAPNCGKSAAHQSGGRNGYCSGHYGRVRKYGSISAGGTGRGEPYNYLCDLVRTDETACISWPYDCDVKGYGRVRINGTGKRLLAHRVLCQLAHGAPPSSDHQAAHSCGNGHLGCCNPNHLRWATTLENQRDRALHGTVLSGARGSASKLTDQDVSEIRKLLGSMSQREIGERFGVSQRTISLIKLGKTWKE